MTPTTFRTVAVSDLVTGRVPMVILRDFIPAWLLDAANRSIDRSACEIEVKQFSNGRLSTLGPWLLKYVRGNMHDYLARANTVDRALGAEGAACLPGLVRNAVQQVFGFKSLVIAETGDGRPYAPAVIRVHGPGISNPLHNDKVARDTADLTDIVLRDTEYQLSAVVGVQECTPGTGVLRVWKKRWTPDDEIFKRPGALGYFDDVVRATPWFDYSPVRGDIYVFFPEFYHAISRVGDGPERRTLGQFIGLPSLDSRAGLVWA